jgi:hypothetical protein
MAEKAPDSPGDDGTAIENAAKFAERNSKSESQRQGWQALQKGMQNETSNGGDSENKKNRHQLPRTAASHDGQTSHRQPGARRRGFSLISESGFVAHGKD